jgi:sec-independent protein translocase protein TatA
MFGSFGWMELLLILIIVLIIFGAGKLPQLGEGIGKAIKGFKKSVNEPEPAENPAIAQGETQAVQPEALAGQPRQAGTPAAAQSPPQEPPQREGRQA